MRGLPRKPNVVVVMCDQLRAFETGCYGNDVVRTPHIDRLAAEGVRFTHAVSNNPVCMPARSCLLSGQYSRRGQGWRIIVAILAVVLIRATGLGITNVAAKVPAMLPLIHLHILVAIAACVYLLRRRRPRVAEPPMAIGEVG